MTIAGHVLVVGGTGMLRQATLRLASQFAAVSVVARHEGRLAAVKAAQPLGGTLHTIAVDYRDGDAFRRALTNAVEMHGRFTLAVGWIRSAAVEARDIVGDMLNVGPDTARYFDVVGSASTNPLAAVDARAQRFARLRYVSYRSIVLGFVSSGSGARWLTDEEISAGVVRAVEDDALKTVVGVVEPWSERP